jgi:hypothetical protein
MKICLNMLLIIFILSESRVLLCVIQSRLFSTLKGQLHEIFHLRYFH